MAGRARLAALTDELSKRTLDCFDIDPIDVTLGSVQRPSHLEYVSAWVERGQTIKDLAKDLADSLRIDITYDALMRYLRQSFGEQETDAALSQARARASHAMAEEALAIVDAPAVDKTDVARAASRARSRQWMAERWNQAQYGSQKGVSVNVSVSSLHLSALQASPQEVTAALTNAQQPSALPSGQPIQVVEQQ